MQYSSRSGILINFVEYFVIFYVVLLWCLYSETASISKEACMQQKETNKHVISCVRRLE